MQENPARQIIYMTKGEKINLAFSFFSILALITALLLNYFRTELFGVIKGYAPHNFGFNMTYFLPLIFLSLLSAFVSLVWLRNQWKNRKNGKLKWLTLILNLPAVCCLLFGIFETLMIMRQY
jgi:hypothetical protein